MLASETTQPEASTGPVRPLREHLEAERLRAVEAAAASLAATGAVSPETLSRLAHVQMALAAVQTELEAHLPSVGSGSEQPLQ